MSTPIIESIDVTKRFDDVLAVDGVNLSLDEGEILSILGPSGCGKTTMLRIFAGFETIDEGEIHIQERLVSAPGFHLPPEQRTVGMMFQEYALFPHLTVAQNVLFGLSKLPDKQKEKRLAEVLELVRLVGLENRYPHELSGGQQQRIALARTLAPRPVTVLLDEPFSNIDATLRAEMRREIETILRDNHITTVFVTHDREEAFAIADRIAVMNDGRIDQIDTPDVLYHSPATRFVARMSGMCNFLSGEVHDGRVVTDLGRLTWVDNDEEYPDGTHLDLLVRLDDFQIAPHPDGDSIVISREFRGDEIILGIETPSGTMLRCKRHHYSTLPTGTHVTLFPTRATPFVAFKRVEIED